MRFWQNPNFNWHAIYQTHKSKEKPSSEDDFDQIRPPEFAMNDCYFGKCYLRLVFNLKKLNHGRGDVIKLNETHLSAFVFGNCVMVIL